MYDFILFSVKIEMVCVVYASSEANTRIRFLIFTINLERFFIFYSLGGKLKRIYTSKGCMEVVSCCSDWFCNLFILWQKMLIGKVFLYFFFKFKLIQLINYFISFFFIYNISRSIFVMFNNLLYNFFFRWLYQFKIWDF